MKYLAVIFCVVILMSCGCAYVDCDSNRVLFYFRVIDESGEDLIFNKGIPLDSLHLSAGGASSWYTAETGGKFLMSETYPGVDSFKLSYKDLSADFVVHIEPWGKSHCCGQEYRLKDITSQQGNVHTEQNLNQDIYIITLLSSR